MGDGRFARLFRLRALRVPAVRHQKAFLAGAAAGVVAAVTAALLTPPRPLLIWNVSASAAIGLYAVGSAAPPARGDLVAARLPPSWRVLGSTRRYIPANVPLIKRVAARAGDRVCAAGADITVNGLRVALRLDIDGAGRPMPRWSGCIVLGRGEYLLLMPGAASFDGRYFGPTAESDIVGKVHLLWTR
ncbi:conjugative transfer signal peptidase TraF [Sphingopyxis sp. OAS728]|uniref:S26 family signal peptidase n=1 Tax=Sphingopyxis sp. OAS728 TaxID=2663823 RepID=UPI00178A3F72|nr:S26 family signal peptidase [Sphingopyxis sp. OAS728]MBE1526865.1 conjugative transfer signal peptidase TraF [Sphingopyxis sp. OAS728]